MKATRLEPAALAAALRELPGWRLEADALRCACRFATFADAVRFTQRLAELADRSDHHPEWTVRYRQVALLTTTHDAGGVTVRDLHLAREILSLVAAAGGVLVSPSE